MRSGRVVSLHIHPERPGDEMTAVPEIQVEAENGIVQDKRYFGRRSRSGQPGNRQITLIEREQIEDHARSLACPPFKPGVVRSNVETEGVSLIDLEGKVLRIGTAQILIGAPRDPCAKMDAIKPGLRGLMEHGRQGVLGRIVRSGTIRVGDRIELLPPSTSEA